MRHSRNTHKLKRRPLQSFMLCRSSVFSCTEVSSISLLTINLWYLYSIPIHHSLTRQHIAFNVGLFVLNSRPTSQHANADVLLRLPHGPNLFSIERNYYASILMMKKTKPLKVFPLPVSTLLLLQKLIQCFARFSNTLP